MNDMDLMPEQENAGLAVAKVTQESELPAAAAKMAAPMTPQQCRVIEVNEALAPAYAKASTLELTDAEVEQLMAPFPPEAVDIRPHDGLIYISHIHISNRLNRVFKPGKWALVRRREWMEGGTMYGEYVLLIRGCYVGESIGGHPYQPNNPKTNYSDTLESTAAEALRRIAGKRLSCGSQVWESGYAQKWVAENAAQVGGKWVKRMVQPAKPAPTPAPKPANVTPMPAKEETPADRKARFIAMCKSAGGGNLSFATDLFREMGTLMDTEDINDIPEDKVPTTRKTAQNIFDEIKSRAGVADDIPMGDTPTQSTPEPAAEPEPEGTKIRGFVAAVTSKPTSKGGLRWGICIVPNRGDKQGGEWLNTFDDVDGDFAKSLKGEAVICYYNEGKYGKDLVHRGIKSDEEIIP